MTNFSSPNSLPLVAQQRPYSILLNDFNGDQNLDIAVANYGTKNVSILLGNGTGGFGAPTPTPDVGTLGPVSIFAGDFNGDGNQDLATANVNLETFSSSNISFLLGNGSGGFSAPSVTTVPVPGLLAIGLGDFNGDNLPDIAAGSLVPGQNDVSVFLSTGFSGGQVTFNSTPFTYTIGQTTRSLDLGDFNNDGLTDLALVRTGVSKVFVRLGTGTGGSGEPIFSSTEASYNVGSEPRSVTIDDIDGDGKLDLVVSNSANDNISLLRGQGNGTFQTATVYSAGDGVRSVATGFINADYALDFVTADELGNTVSVLINNTPGDSLTGSTANDTYTVDSTTDVITENPNGGTDTVNSSVTYTLPSNVENINLTGSNNINATGNNLTNGIRGNDGNNTLDGSGGSDYLYGNGGSDNLLGGAGDDYISGGAGVDTMEGGTGNDLYEVDNSLDIVTENANEGIDTVNASVTYTLGNNVENLTLTGFSDINGTGNNLNNDIRGNNGNNTLDGMDGQDYLYGNGGNDSLLGGSGDDYLFGGTGVDTMRGGTGNDVYEVDNSLDVVIENAGEGIDEVQSYVTYTLGNNVERLTLLGSGNTDGTGNDSDNAITGNNGSNNLSGGVGSDYLYGLGGDDTLIGGSGNDFLIGGSGNNTFRFLSSADGIDTITDFKAGDAIQIVASGFGLVAPNPVGPALSGAAFISGIGVTEATNGDQRFIYNTSSGTLFFDADGNGASGKVQIATFSNVAGLTAGDIFLI